MRKIISFIGAISLTTVASYVLLQQLFVSHTIYFGAVAGAGLFLTIGIAWLHEDFIK